MAETQFSTQSKIFFGLALSWNPSLHPVQNILGQKVNPESRHVPVWSQTEVRLC